MTNFDRVGLDLRVSNDDGSTLVLGLGLIGVVLLALSVVTDASLAFLQRQALQVRADAAALAGVQAIDLDEYYRQGATAFTALVPSSARQRALVHVQREQQWAPIAGLEVTEVRATVDEVTIVLSAPVRTAFWPVQGHITVSSAASLDYVD